MSSKVFISVGHGGTDSGAVGNGLIEKNVNLDIALACNNFLVKHGVLTLMSRTTDEDDRTAEEVVECNAFNPDVAVSFHNNAGRGDGAEAYCSVNRGFGDKVGVSILKKLKALGQNIRSGSTNTIQCKIKLNESGKDYYYFIRKTMCPAVLLETAFLDNANDVTFIDTLEKRNIIGVECAKGILETLGIKYVEEQQTVVENKKRKTNGELAVEVIDGKWGTGAERKKKLEAQGYDYNAIQKLVNKVLGYNNKKPKKSNEEIAEEVIDGKWGNGEERKERLTQAGYNYNSVQRIVNQKVGG